MTPPTSDQNASLERYPIDDATIDFNTSCTIEDAIGKMLGWLKGSLRYESSERTVTLADLPYIDTLPYSLDELLLDLRYEALVAVTDTQDTDQIAKASKEVFLIDALINKAGRYQAYIVDELSKGELSALRLDHAASDQTGEPHITLASLEKWASETFPKDGIEIFGELSTPKLSIDLKAKVTRQPHSEDRGGMSPTTAKSFKITLGLLAEAFSDKPKYRLSSGKVNVSGLATIIADKAKELNFSERMKNQGAEAIKDKIEEGLKALKAELPAK